MTAKAQALMDVLKERRSILSTEGWSEDQPNPHEGSKLAAAGACYAMHAVAAMNGQTDDSAPAEWPWSEQWWNPNTPRFELVKAAALILAEIERLDEIEARKDFYEI